MKPGLNLAATAMLLMIILPSAYCAESGKVAEPDSSKSSTIFDPPRVLTPEDTSAALSLEPHAGQPAKADRKPAVALRSKTGRPGGCAQCSGRPRFRFGGGGGPVPAYLFANLDEINVKVRAMGIPELAEDFLMMGGKGYARIGSFIIGGGGYGGSTESSGIPDCCARYAEMVIGYGGMILGYSRPVGRYDMTAGILVGGGSVKIERRRNARDVYGWDDSWDLFMEDDPDSVATEDISVSSVIRADFIAIEPFVEVLYWVLPFVAIDVSGTYLRANIDRGTWKLDGVKIPDSPETDIGGLGIKLGLHFGV